MTKEIMDISESFTPQKLEFMKAGGSYAIVFLVRSYSLFLVNF